MATADGRKVYFEGILDHKQGGNKERYVSLYVVLAAREILIYADYDKVKLLGKLTLDLSTKVKAKDKKGQHRIDLLTREFDKHGKSSERRNVFRSESRTDRDIWYAYIHAMTTRQIPHNLKISPVIMTNIEKALQDCVKSRRRGSEPNISQSHATFNFEKVVGPPQEPEDYNYAYDDGWVQTSQARTGRSNSDSTDGYRAGALSPGGLQPVPEQHSPYSGHKPHSPYAGHKPHSPYSGGHRPGRRASERDTSSTTTRRLSHDRRLPEPLPEEQARFSRQSCSSSSSEETTSRGTAGSSEYGGVYRRHKFFTNDTMNKTTPPWFFENCTRQETDLALEKGKDYGNMLIRESKTFRESGSYVVDSRLETRGGFKMIHIEVIQRNGLVIRTRDGTDETFSSLSEVMSFMPQLLGDCRPMSTNDRTLLGIQDPDYDTVESLKILTMRKPSPDCDSPKTPPVPKFRETGYESEGSDAGSDYLPMNDPDPYASIKDEDDDDDDYIPPDQAAIPPEVFQQISESPSEAAPSSDITT